MIIDYIGFHGCEAKCDIEVYRTPRVAGIPPETLVVATELPDNHGTSITNAAEDLATAVCRVLEVSPQGFHWIEHYPDRGSRHQPIAESWDRVYFGFDWREGRFVKPRWRHANLETVNVLRAFMGRDDEAETKLGAAGCNAFDCAGRSQIVVLGGRLEGV